MKFFQILGKKSKRNYKIDDLILNNEKKIFLFTGSRADYGIF